MRKSAFISDVLFAFFLTFLFLLCLFRHLRISLPLSFLLAAAFGGVTGWLTAVRLQKKTQRRFLEKIGRRKKRKAFIAPRAVARRRKNGIFQNRLK